MMNYCTAPELEILGASSEVQSVVADGLLNTSQLERWQPFSAVLRRFATLSDA